MFLASIVLALYPCASSCSSAMQEQSRVEVIESPDRTLTAQINTRTRRVMNIVSANNVVRHTIELPQESTYTGVAWSPDSHSLVYSISKPVHGEDPVTGDPVIETSYAILNVQTGTRFSLDDSTFYVVPDRLFVSWNLTSQLIALPNDKLNFGIWNLRTGTKIRTISFYGQGEEDMENDSHVNFIDYLELSPNGLYIAASASDDSRIKIWSVSIGTQMMLNDQGKPVVMSDDYDDTQHGRMSIVETPFGPIDWEPFDT